MQKLIDVQEAKEFASTFLADPILKMAVNAVLDNAPAAKDIDVPGKWIPVTERLPDGFGTYLVAIDEVHGEKRISVDSADFDPFEKKWSTFNYFCAGYKITHWMPLPEPPKEIDYEMQI